MFWKSNGPSKCHNYTEIEDVSSPTKQRRGVIVVGAFLISVALSVVSIIGFKSSQSSTSLLISLTPNVGISLASNAAITSAEMTTISLVVSNEYTAKHGHPGKAYRWIKVGTLVEPHKTTTLELTGLPSRLSGHSLSCKAVHAITGEAADEVSSAGLSVSDATVVPCLARFKRPGDYSVDVTVNSREDGAILGISKHAVVCRYVRRDLRKLSTADRDAFLDAVKTTFEISDTDGVTIYGAEYKSMSYFVTLHLDSSVPNKHHDYMHDGMGFLSQHIAITNEFETALQVVNPAVAVPFWDFTQDYSMIKAAATLSNSAVYYPDLWKLDVWGSDFFGDATGTSQHTVIEGRWAYTQVPRASSSKALNGNALGFLRAPWNLHESPYITRYHKECGKPIDGSAWPTCSAHYSAVFDVDDLSEFIIDMMFSAHGGVHTLIGGTGGGCETWGESMDALIGPGRVSIVAEYAAFILRDTWRHGICTEPSKEDCAGSAEGKVDHTKCKLTCSGCAKDNFSAEDMTNYVQWFDDSFMDGLSSFQKEQFVRTLFCDTKWFIGEHAEASSPVDVSFWPIHTTLERLMQYKQIVNPLTVLSWDASPYESSWTSLCKWGAIFNVSCTGHGIDDATSGKMTVLDDDGNYKSRYLTNYEVLELANPESTHRLPYIYADFDYSHCESEGYYFTKIDDATGQ